MFTFGKTPFVGLTIALALAAGMPACAEPAPAASPRSEVLSVLREVEAGIARGDSPEKSVNLMYAPDVIIVGEEDVSARRGLKPTVEAVAAFQASLGPNGAKGCRYELPAAEVSSATTFTSFVLLRCKANPPALPEDLDLRMIYSWAKRPDGWKIVLEMWGVGKL